MKFQDRLPSNCLEIGNKYYNFLHWSCAQDIFDKLLYSLLSTSAIFCSKHVPSDISMLGAAQSMFDYSESGVETMYTHQVSCRYMNASMDVSNVISFVSFCEAGIGKDNHFPLLLRAPRILDDSTGRRGTH
jgi:hypothetical protein